MNRRNKSRRKSNPEKELYMLIFELVFIPMFMFFMIIISNIVLDYSVLVGTIMRNLAYIIMFLFPLIVFLRSFKKNIKEYKERRKKIEKSLLTIIIVLIFGLFIFYRSLILINAMKDCCLGTKEVYIMNYKVQKFKTRKLNPGYDNFIGYDKEGNEYKLKSKIYISEYEDKVLKIKYYENLKIIESFEYLEKNS